MRKPIILYIAPDYKNADFFLSVILARIKPVLVLRMSHQEKTFETTDYIVKAVSITDCHKVIGVYQIKYFLQSKKKFEICIESIENLYYSLQEIKARLSIDAEEITIDELVSILDAFEDKQYCCTCKWYDVDNGTCFNGGSEHRADFRCLDDSCDCWEECENDR